MRSSGWSPSIVPHDDRDVCLVVDDLGRVGRVWREADVETADLATVIDDMLNGQYSNPVGVVAFNSAEGWSRDVSEDVAQKISRRCGLEGREIPESVRDFVERHAESDRRQLSLRLG